MRLWQFRLYNIVISKIVGSKMPESHVLKWIWITFFRFDKVGVAGRSQFFRFSEVRNWSPCRFWRF